jgi:hypothetical protein
MNQSRAFILIAPDFDEPSVVQCLCTLRSEGIATSVVSISDRLVTGVHGLTIKPDLLLTQLEQKQRTIVPHRYTLIISGGQTMSTSLQIDPRIQQLIETTFVHGGTVVFMSPVPDSLAEWIGQGTVLQQDHTPQFWAQIVNSSLV